MLYYRSVCVSNGKRICWYVGIRRSADLDYHLSMLEHIIGLRTVMAFTNSADFQLVPDIAEPTITLGN